MQHLRAAGRRPDVNAEFNNAALYLPEESTIFLNSKADFTQGEGLRIMGEELGHNAMTQVIANDPGIVMLEAARFSDPKGKTMLLSAEDGSFISVNKEMSNFVDSYNKTAKQSGAPEINTFEQALQEWYGAQAGIDMASNKVSVGPREAPLGQQGYAGYT